MAEGVSVRRRSREVAPHRTAKRRSMAQGGLTVGRHSAAKRDSMVPPQLTAEPVSIA